MSCYSDRVLLFPKVDQGRLNMQKIEKTSQMRQKILLEMKRNQTSSLYNINQSKHLQASFSLSRKKHPRHVCSPKKQLINLNEIRLGHKRLVFNDQEGKEAKEKKMRLIFERQDSKLNDSASIGSLEKPKRPDLRIKSEQNVSSHFLSPVHLKPTINIKRVQGTVECGQIVQHKYFKSRQKIKQFYHKISRAKRADEAKRLQQIQFKFTLLHGWKTDEQAFA